MKRTNNGLLNTTQKTKDYTRLSQKHVVFTRYLRFYYSNDTYTVKLVHVVTSVKQPPVLKGHIFFPVIENII